MSKSVIMSDDKPIPKVRIIDVERKFAAQISDVWTDMKIHLERKIKSEVKATKNRTNQSPQSADSAALVNTASSQNHS
jgi:DNA replication initiation complex subunit (GINS family)